MALTLISSPQVHPVRAQVNKDLGRTYAFKEGDQVPQRSLPSIFSVTPKPYGSSGSLRKPFCEVTPASGQERFVWSPLDKRSQRRSPGPWLLTPDARPLSQPWQCRLYQGERLLGTAVYLTELSHPGPRPTAPQPQLQTSPLHPTSRPNPTPTLPFPTRELTTSSCQGPTHFHHELAE